MRGAGPGRSGGPWASAPAWEALPSTAFDQPHDQRSARHRQQQSAGATQQQCSHEPAQERATIPTTSVMPMLIGLGPGMTSRPRAPTISPDSNSPRIQSNTMTVSQLRRPLGVVPPPSPRFRARTGRPAEPAPSSRSVATRGTARRCKLFRWQARGWDRPRRRRRPRDRRGARCTAPNRRRAAGALDVSSIPRIKRRPAAARARPTTPPGPPPCRRVHPAGRQ
jgi:hypothetical protein